MDSSIDEGPIRISDGGIEDPVILGKTTEVPVVRNHFRIGLAVFAIGLFAALILHIYRNIKNFSNAQSRFDLGEMTIETIKVTRTVFIRIMEIGNVRVLVVRIATLLMPRFLE